jgi:hypothetical protein
VATRWLAKRCCSSWDAEGIGIVEYLQIDPVICQIDERRRVRLATRRKVDRLARAGREGYRPIDRCLAVPKRHPVTIEGIGHGNKSHQRQKAINLR